MSENGKLPPSELAPIAQGQLEISAAAAWNCMNVEARSRGIELVPTGSMSSYRTYDQQVYLYQQYLNGTGALAAVPGTSNHGWGLAVDVPTQQMRSMIDQIGSKYGWAKRCSDAQSEWWHLKYAPDCCGAPSHFDDPGPYGAPKFEGEVMAIATAQMKDGRIEIFVEDKDGEIWHAWNSKDGSGGGWARRDDGSFFFSMGKPH